MSGKNESEPIHRYRSKKSFAALDLAAGPAHLSRLRSEQDEDVDEDKNKDVDIKDKEYDTEEGWRRSPR